MALNQLNGASDRAPSGGRLKCWRVVGLLPLGAMLSLGCGPALDAQEPASASKVKVETISASDVLTEPRTVNGTAGEVNLHDAMGHALQGQIEAAATKAILGEFDLDAFQKRVFSRVPKSDSNTKAMSDFAPRIMNELTGPGMGGLITQVVDNVKNKGSYQYLTSGHKQYKLQLRDVLVFRMIQPDGNGVNYHDYVVESRGGAIKIVDVYSYLYGEDLSESLRRDFMLEAESNPFATSGGEDDPLWRSRVEIKALKDAVGKADFPAALQIWNALPPRVKEDQLVRILRLQAARPLPGASEKDKQVFHDAYKDFSLNYKGGPEASTGQNPARDLYGIDGFLTVGDFPTSLDCVKNLEAALGEKDPYLNVLRAGIHIGEAQATGSPKTLESARNEAKAALSAAFDKQNGGGRAGLYDAFWKLIGATVSAEPTNQESAFDATMSDIRGLMDPPGKSGISEPPQKKSLRNDLRGNLKALARVPRFSAGTLLNSPEYRAMTSPND